MTQEHVEIVRRSFEAFNQRDELRGGQVYSFRGGRVSAVENYYDAGEALKAVGVSPRDPRARS